MRGFFLLILVHLVFGAEINALANCPKADATHRYTLTRLISENLGDAPDLLVYYTLLAPFDASKPTLLVINGGPGGDSSIINTFEKTALAKKLNIVGFDHRGLGCTKTLGPDSTLYKTGIFAMRRAAGDIDAIRKDLLGENGCWRSCRSAFF